MDQLFRDLHGCTVLKRSQHNTCAYFNVILRARKEYTDDMWWHYDANYRQRAEATHNTDWSTIDPAIFNQCSTGRTKQVQYCSTWNSIKHDSIACPRKNGKHPMMARTTPFHPLNNQNRGWRCATTSTTIAPATIPPAPVRTHLPVLAISCMCLLIYCTNLITQHHYTFC